MLRLQPVVPFGLVTVRSNPPANQPQESPAAFSRSPTFLPLMVTWLRVGAEQTSPIGSASPIRVRPPWPSATSSPDPLSVALIPLVCPEIRLIAPGEEGPKFELYELSFSAYAARNSRMPLRCCHRNNPSPTLWCSQLEDKEQRYCRPSRSSTETNPSNLYQMKLVPAHRRDSGPRSTLGCGSDGTDSTLRFRSRDSDWGCWQQSRSQPVHRRRVRKRREAWLAGRIQSLG